MAGWTESTAAELAAIADNVEQYRSRVGGLAEPWIGTDREDIVSAGPRSRTAAPQRGTHVNPAIKVCD